MVYEGLSAMAPFNQGKANNTPHLDATTTPDVSCRCNYSLTSGYRGLFMEDPGFTMWLEEPDPLEVTTCDPQGGCQEQSGCATLPMIAHFEGFCYPALQQVVVHWSPPSERTKFSSLINAGAPVGTVTVLTMAGFLADRLGWESIFYVSGAMTIIWYLAWIFMVYDSPILHPCITDEELILITGYSKTHHRLSNANQVRQKIPWRSILTSVPVWVMIGAHTGQNWGTYTLLTSLPTYMKHILHFNLSSNGVFSALPYLAMWFVGVFSGYSSDMLRTRKVLSTTNVRKLYNTIGNVVPTIAIIAVGFVGCDSIAAVALLTIGTGFSGCTAASNQVNSIDLSPAFSSVIYGISNTIANIPGIVSPYTVGLITAGPNGQTISNWRIIFYLSGAVRMAAAVPYLLFASGELADWNETGHKELSQDKEGAENAFD